MLQHTEAKYDDILTKDCAAPLEASTDFVIASGAIPKIFTDMPYGSYKQWTIDSLLRNQMKDHDAGSEFEEGDLELEEIAYACKEYAIKMKVVDRNRVKNELESKGKTLLVNGYRNLDAKLATILNSGANFGATYAGTTNFTKWSDASSTPIADVALYKQEIHSKTGLEPRHMIISADVFAKLKGNADIRGAMRADNDKILTAQILARFFDMDEVYVMKGVSNAGKKGATSQTKALQVTDTVLIYHRGEDDVLAPSCLKVFFNTEYGTDTNGVILETYRDINLRCDVVRAIQDFIIKVTTKDLGILLTDVI